MDKSYLNWPFLEDRHRQLATTLDDWAREHIAPLEAAHGSGTNVDGICADLLARLADGGWLAHAVPANDAAHDVRSLCLIREILAYHSGLADFVFAMQGLGTGPIALAGSAAQKKAYEGPVRSGEKIAAFALTEADAGTDVARIATSATRRGDSWVLNGEKTFISNGGIADFYCVFARTGEGRTDLGAFIVDADAPGFDVAERIDVIAPHPLGRLRFDNCEIAADRMIGAPGDGFKIAMGTLDVFRTSVGAAALGFGRRAMDEALGRARSREMFGGKLADLQITQSILADMALDLDTAALLIYRAAWQRATSDRPITREAAMAKLHATEAASRVIDRAVQMFGGQGVVSGETVEKLYREVRALRIYEGASEIQKVIIARQLLKDAP